LLDSNRSDLARRVDKLIKARAYVAHPDVTLTQDVCAVLTASPVMKESGSGDMEKGLNHNEGLFGDVVADDEDGSSESSQLLATEGHELLETPTDENSSIDHGCVECFDIGSADGGNMDEIKDEVRCIRSHLTSLVTVAGLDLKFQFLLDKVAGLHGDDAEYHSYNQQGGRARFSWRPPARKYTAKMHTRRASSAKARSSTGVCSTRSSTRTKVFSDEVGFGEDADQNDMDTDTCLGGKQVQDDEQVDLPPFVPVLGDEGFDSPVARAALHDDEHIEAASSTSDKCSAGELDYMLDEGKDERSSNSGSGGSDADDVKFNQPPNSSSGHMSNSDCDTEKSDVHDSAVDGEIDGDTTPHTHNQSAAESAQPVAVAETMGTAVADEATETNIEAPQTAIEAHKMAARMARFAMEGTQRPRQAEAPAPPLTEAARRAAREAGFAAERLKCSSKPARLRLQTILAINRFAPGSAHCTL